MNQERSHAYGRVVKTLTDMGPSKLFPHEQDRIRDAADSLIFCLEAGEHAANTAADIESLASQLVESDRWTLESAEQLVDDVAACGPFREPALVG